MRMHAVIVPPVEALSDLGQAVDRAARAAPSLPWLPRLEWQLRLAYFGNLGLAEASTVRETLTKIGSYCAPLRLHVKGVEAVPEDAKADAVTVGLAGDIEELWSLARAIPSMVQPHGLFLDRRSFRSSITVARGSRGPFDARAATSQLADYEGPPWVGSEMRVVRWMPGGVSEPDDWETVDAYQFTGRREDDDAARHAGAAH